MKIKIFSIYGIIMAFCCLSVYAQSMDSQQLSPINNTDSVSSQKYHSLFDTGHVFPLFIMCHDPNHIQNNYFDPQLPAFWVGGMTLREGFLGHQAEGVPTKEGFLRQSEFGYTLLQLSKGLFSDSFGATSAFQVGMGIIGLDKDYEMKREEGNVGFVAVQETFSSSAMNYVFLRIPVLFGIQNRKHWLSLLSGPSLDFCVPGRDNYYYEYQNEEKEHHRRFHANLFSINWQVMAGIGPVTVSYSHSLVPLFKLTDGTSVYPSSLSIGLDLWYLLRRN